MTLCKNRPSRSYDEQFILDAIDVHGLLKEFDARISQMGEDGLASTSLYAGGLLAFQTLFLTARDNGEVDKYSDFFEAFDNAVSDLEGSD